MKMKKKAVMKRVGKVGRKPLPPSVRKRNERAYQKKYLAKRRMRYKTDAEYRAKVIARRREQINELKETPSKGYGVNAGSALEFSTERKVVSKGGNVSPTYTLTMAEMAVFLNNSPSVFSGWVKSGKFPRPALQAHSLSGAAVMVYTDAQANCFAHVLRTHMANRSSLRKTDTRVIALLHAAMK